MSSDPSNPRRREGLAAPIPRDAEHCEKYLDRLAIVIARAGPNAAAFLPIVRRLERELAEAAQDAGALERLRARLASGSFTATNQNQSRKE